MSNWKAGMAFDSILQTPLDYYDVTYANGNTVRYEKERPHGEWKNERFSENHSLYFGKCSQCGKTGVTGNFCMWCGADMRKMGEAE